METNANDNPADEQQNPTKAAPGAGGQGGAPGQPGEPGQPGQAGSDGAVIIELVPIDEDAADPKPPPP